MLLTRSTNRLYLLLTAACGITYDYANASKSFEMSIFNMIYWKFFW